MSSLKLAFLVFALLAGSINSRAGVVEIKNNQLFVDGKSQPQLWGAEIQYFRLRGGTARNIPRKTVIDLWSKALDRAVEAKMNAVSFYIPWDFHEYAEGKFDFDGTVDEDGDGKPDYPSRDVRTFIRMIEARGIHHMMARPGPFINAEWGFLGFGAIPLWFHEKYPNSHARNPRGNRTTLYNYHDADFLKHSRIWLNTVFEQVLKPHVGLGRPISFIQIDNETNLMWQSAYNHDYGPQSTRRYQNYLKNKFRELEKLNSAHQRSWKSWSEVQPPTRASENKFEDQDWYRFQDYSMYDYLKKIRGMWTDMGVREPTVLFTLAESYNAPEHGILPNYQLRNSKDTGMMTVNLYPKTYETADNTLMNLPFKSDHDVKAADSASDYYLGHREEWLLGPEIQGGWWKGINVSKESRRQTYLTTVGHGLKALFIYYFNEGDNWQHDWLKKAITPYYNSLKNEERYRDVPHEKLPESFWNEFHQNVAEKFLEVDVRGIWWNGGTQPEKLYFDAPLGADALPREPYYLVKELGEKVFAPYGEFLSKAVAVEDAVCVVKDSKAHAPSLVAGVNSRVVQSDWNAGLLALLMHAGINPRFHHWGLNPVADLLDQNKCKLIVYQDTGFADQAFAATLLKALEQGTSVLSFLHTGLVNQILSYKSNTQCSQLPLHPMNVEGYRCQIGQANLYHAKVPIYDVFNTDFYYRIHDAAERRGVFEYILKDSRIAPMVKIVGGADRTVAFAREVPGGPDLWITAKTAKLDGARGNLQWAAANPGRKYLVTDILTSMSLEISGAELSQNGFPFELGSSGSSVFFVKAQPETSLEAWIDSQKNLSEKFLMLNVSPIGATAGTVVASPSRDNPNYYFHWTRDAALVMYSVDDKNAINDYVTLSNFQQIAPGLHGAGEPRFRIDGTPDTIEWARPQYDGPALRALTMLKILKSRSGDQAHRKLVLEILRRDLEYVTRTWTLPCFDLWEELSGIHFYTQAAQYAALKTGGDFFKTEGDLLFSRELLQHALNVEKSLETFWDPKKEYIGASRELKTRPESPQYKNENLDTSVILAALHSQSAKPNGILSVTDDRLLATAHALETAFAKEYKINWGVSTPAIGRFTDDVYFGGNPWYLTTLAFAEFYYRIHNTFKQDATTVTINNRNINFFRALNLRVPQEFFLEQKISFRSQAGQHLLVSLRNKGDQFLSIVRRHVGSNGEMSEQFDRNTGRPVSAPHLTWSYASFLAAVAQR